MTTMFDSVEDCAICGTENRCRFVGSYSTRGSMTSGRPIFLGLDPIPGEVNCCTKCGYCAIYLNENIGITIDDLQTKQYLEALESREYHECYAMLLSKVGRHEEASVMYHHGAWIFDDGIVHYRWELRSKPKNHREIEVKAIACKEKADRLRWMAIHELLETSPFVPGRRLIMADLLRCVGVFDEARDQVLKSMDDPRNVKYNSIARQIMNLIDEKSDWPNVICNPKEGDDPVVREMKIDSQSFTSINSGRKTLELYVNNRKHRGIRVGDIIEFRDWKSSAVTYVDVTDIELFSNFEELYSAVPHKRFDPDGLVPTPNDTMKHFCKQDQEQNGVLAVGFRVHPINPKW